MVYRAEDRDPDLVNYKFGTCMKINQETVSMFTVHPQVTVLSTPIMRLSSLGVV